MAALHDGVARHQLHGHGARSPTAGGSGGAAAVGVPRAREEVRRARGRHRRRTRGARAVGGGPAGPRDRAADPDRELDWVAKYRCSRATASETGSTGRDPSCGLIDLQYHDVRRDTASTPAGAAGKVERLTTDEEVERAVMEPPDRHPGVFPRAMHLGVPGRDRRRLVGLDHHGHRPRCPAADPDAGAAPGHARARRGSAPGRARTPRPWWTRSVAEVFVRTRGVRVG